MAEIKVAFWNIQNLFDTKASPIAADLEFTPSEGWTTDVLKAKLTNLASIINQMHDGNGPDLLGLCEVENRKVVEDLIAKTGRDDYRLAHIDSPDIRGIDCSLIYSTRVFNDPSDEDIQAHLVHFRYPTRDIFQVRLTLKDTGSELVVLVNHWPSRWIGQYKSEPLRIAVGERCGQLVDEVLKVDRASFWEIPNSEEGMAQLNSRWNRNVLLMGDFNDDPYNRSITDYLLASKDLDKVEELLKPEKDQNIPSIKSYLKRKPVLFNLFWKFLSVPDTGTHFYSGETANTMNVFDQFIISRGLYYGESGLKAKAGSSKIFRPANMVSGSKKRPKKFKKDTKKGFSDHFPIEMVIDSVATQD